MTLTVRCTLCMSPGCSFTFVLYVSFWTFHVLCCMCQYSLCTRWFILFWLPLGLWYPWFTFLYLTYQNIQVKVFVKIVQSRKKVRNMHVKTPAINQYDFTQECLFYLKDHYLISGFAQKYLKKECLKNEVFDRVSCFWNVHFQFILKKL